MLYSIYAMPRKAGFTLISKACKGFTLISGPCKGFTLIELLVVVSLIGILATLVLANLTEGRSRARDTQRKSDLRNISTSLRLYYNDTGSYPASDSDSIVACNSHTNPVSCVWGEGWSVGNTVYMQTLPSDPLASGTVQQYKYTSDIVNDTYTLEACLENQSDDKGQAIDAGETDWCTSDWKYVLTP